MQNSSGVLWDRRHALKWAAVGAAALAGSETASAQPQVEVKPRVEGSWAWYDVQHWGVEGRGWEQTQRFFDRLPSGAQKLVRPPVWNLSRHSAGMCVRFATDAVGIRARYRLLSPRLAMPHMPATGVSGVDLYVRHQDRWHWLGVGWPKAQDVLTSLAGGIEPPGVMREYLLYLPLYNGVERLEIGVPRGARFRPLPPRKKPLLVYYGTSITQGACASRPGMAFLAILGRKLNCPVVNLGFSGNGRMELELADLMGQLDAAAYGVDCLPNLQPHQVQQRTVPFVLRLRKHRPEVPIVLIEDRSYADSVLVAAKRRRNLESRKALRRGYERLLKMGIKNLYYLEGENLLGADGEGTTDSSHPNDLGMMRMAEALHRVFAPLLGSG